MSGPSRSRCAPSQSFRWHVPYQLGPEPGARQVPRRRGQGQCQRHGRPKQDRSALCHSGTRIYSGTRSYMTQND